MCINIQHLLASATALYSMNGDLQIFDVRGLTLFLSLGIFLGCLLRRRFFLLSSFFFATKF